MKKTILMLLLLAGGVALAPSGCGTPAKVTLVSLRRMPAIMAVRASTADQISAEIPAAISEVARLLTARRIKAAGASFAVFDSQHPNQFQAGIPISTKYKRALPRGLHQGYFPSATALKISVTGAVNVPGGYKALDDETARRGAVPTRFYVEVYPSPAGTAPDEMQIEIYALLK